MISLQAHLRELCALGVLGVNFFARPLPIRFAARIRPPRRKAMPAGLKTASAPLH